jgi:hypothetical protein
MYAKGNERFDGLTEQELLRRATREMLIALIVVAEVLRLHAHMLVPKKTGETATLLRALGARPDYPGWEGETGESGEGNAC